MLFGSGVVVTGVFQFDPNNPRAMTTRYHILASLVTFPSVTLPLSMTSWGLAHDARWPDCPNRFVAPAIAGLAVVLFVVFMLSVTTRWEGLTQRGFLLLLTGWVAYHAYKIRELTRTTVGHPGDANSNRRCRLCCHFGVSRCRTGPPPRNERLCDGVLNRV